MDYPRLRFSSLPSSNTYLIEHWTEFGPFAFVRTDFQSAGKGRGDHTWSSAPGENLLFSMLIKNPDASKVGLYSLGAAVAVTLSLKELGLDGLTIKWPNDVYCGDKKICGILLQGSLPDYLVIGIGVNVNQKTFEGDYAHAPTSYYLEKGEEGDNDKLFDLICGYLVNYFDVASIEGDKLLREFRKRDYLYGKNIRRLDKGKTVSGVAIGVDEAFNLIVNEDGKRRLINSGEILI